MKSDLSRVQTQMNKLNLFELVYLRLHNIYNSFTSGYVNFLMRHVLKLVLVYLIATCIFSLGLFQIKFDKDTDSLALVSQSESKENAKVLNKTFITNQHERHFNNKLLDLGYYFEFIITVRETDANRRLRDDDFLEPAYNLINKTILEQYNQLFDQVMSLQIEDTQLLFDDTTNNSYLGLKNYTFMEDLCAKRLQKCSIEGGLIRKKSFQEKFLKHLVSVAKNDLKRTYIDIEETDAINFNLIFGKYVQTVETTNPQTHSVELNLVHAATIRNRFDLLASTERERRLAVKFMDKYVELMSGLKQNDTFSGLNVSYYTSRSLNDEIEKYSKLDTHYVVLSFMLFWLLVYVAFIYNSIKRIEPKESNLSRWRLASLFHNYKLSLCGGLFLPSVMIVQIVLTLTAVYGGLSLIGVSANFLTSSIVFIITSELHFVCLLFVLSNRIE